MKIVINGCFGGFSLSEQALKELGGEQSRTQVRNDPRLVEIVERLGDAANGPYAKLRIVEIPDNVNWQIAEYDGYEHVEEVHRTWEW